MRMTILLLTTLGLLASTHAFAARRHASGAAEEIILRHHLLTPAELACSSIVYGNKAAGEVTQVTVVWRGGSVCPTGRVANTRLFDLYIDNVSRSVQWAVDPLELNSLL